MTTEQLAPALDEERLHRFVFRAVEEVGATLNAALVVAGDGLGYFTTLTADGPLTADELAERCGTPVPYAREWLNALAAGSFVEFDPTTGRYDLPAEHAVALTDETSPAYLVGLVQLAVGTVADSRRVIESARAGEGFGWHEHCADVHHGCERFFAPSYRAHLVSSWLPAAGVDAALRDGIRVADLGCGHGASTILMAQAYPRSRFVGSDYHPESIATARRRAVEAGVDDRVVFETAAADQASGRPVDLVTTFDALHDLGDPDGAARHVHELLAPDGRWLIVEPMAGERVEDNLNPVGRAYYAFSTLLCTPASLSQPVGAALGTQAGPARIADIVTRAGFADCRTVAETPFHRVMVCARS